MLVSDGGNPFAIDATPVESGFGVLTSLIQILMEQVRGLEFERIEQRHAAGNGPKPLWFSIDSTNGEAQTGDASLASGIGTNLMRLPDGQMGVLLRHGGARSGVDDWRPCDQRVVRGQTQQHAQSN